MMEIIKGILYAAGVFLTALPIAVIIFLLIYGIVYKFVDIFLD